MHLPIYECLNQSVRGGGVAGATASGETMAYTGPGRILDLHSVACEPVERSPRTVSALACLAGPAAVYRRKDETFEVVLE